MSPHPSMKKRIESLRETIAHHEELYRDTLLPAIDDAQFDLLMNQLKELEAKYPEYAKPHLPASDGFQGQRTLPHAIPMLSIQATTKLEEIRHWHASLLKPLRAVSKTKMLTVLMPKLDGMALSLTYRRGRLVHALTRGRAGQEGQVVTEQALRLRGIPKTIPIFSSPKETIVRGEVVVPLEAYQRFQRDPLNVGYSHPRMAAVSALRSSDDSLADALEATFVPYRLFQPEIARSMADQLDYLDSLGFRAVRYWVLGEKNFEDADLKSRLFSASVTSSLPTDGIVLAVNHPSASAIFGQTEHHPNWMIALKPPAKKASSTLRSVEFNVSRTGAVVPVAIIDPVELLGKQIASLSLHSVGFLKARDLHLLDLVKVELVHDVVPHFAGAFTRNANPSILIPTHCPSCQEALCVTSSGLGCPNRSGCPAQTVERFLHFAGPKGMNIRGLGGELIETLVAQGKLQSFSDVYRLTEDTLRTVLGHFPRRARNVWVAIQESRFTSLQRLLVAFGIKGLGPSFAKPLVVSFQHDLLKMLETTDPSVFAEIAKISLGRAKHLIASLQSHKDEFRALLDLGISWNLNTSQGTP